MSVDGVAHLVAGPVPGQNDMRHLGGGVHAGIGAAGGAYSHIFTAELPDRLLDRLLHRGLVGLMLPAGELAAVIFDIEPKTRHALRSFALALSGERREGGSVDQSA